MNLKARAGRVDDHGLLAVDALEFDVSHDLIAADPGDGTELSRQSPRGKALLGGRRKVFLCAMSGAGPNVTGRMLDWAVFLFVVGLEGLCRRLSLSGCVRLGGILSVLPQWLGCRYNAVIEENWRHAFGEPVSRSWRGELWRRMCGNLLASVRFPSLDKEARARAVTVMGERHLRGALAAGKGVVLLTGHLGAWEILGQAAERFPGVRFSTLFQPLRNRRLNRWVRMRRGSVGVRLLSRGGAWRQACERLRGGEVVAVFADQHAGRGGIWTPFFGKLASTSPLPGMLAARTGATIVPVAVETLGEGRWAVHFRAPVEARGVGLGEVAHRLNLVLEEMIRRAPGDWFWVHERWKIPNPEFLLSAARRGCHIPTGVALKPFRILLRAPNWLGDAVMQLRLVASLKAGRPDAHLSVLCQPRLADLFRRLPFIDEVIETAVRKSVLATATKLRRRHYDVALLVPASWRVVLEAWFGGVRRRAGYRLRGRGRFAINHKVPVEGHGHRWEHQSLGWLRAVECFGGKAVTEPPALGASSGLARTIGVIAPGAEYGRAKRWPAERFAEVARGLRPSVEEWVIVGSAGDAGAAASVAKRLGDGCRDVSGHTSLNELIELLRKAKVVLCNDSGVMHLAAGCGAPVVAVFGSTEPRLTRPIHGGVAIVRRHVPCSPCFCRECPLGHYDCLQKVEVGDVRVVAGRLLEGVAGPPIRGLAWEPGPP